MADMSDLVQMKMLSDDDKGGWGSGVFLWIILIFLFFLAFSDGGLFGGSGRSTAQAVTTLDLTQIERDVLEKAAATNVEVLNNRYLNEREILQNRYDMQLAFQTLGSKMQDCCCELKTLVIEQNQATRDLMQSQYIDGLRTDLSDAKTALSNYNQTQNILGTMGNWYMNPCYGGCSRGCGSCGYN